MAKRRCMALSTKNPPSEGGASGFISTGFVSTAHGAHGGGNKNGAHGAHGELSDADRSSSDSSSGTGTGDSQIEAVESLDSLGRSAREIPLEPWQCTQGD